MSTKYQNFAKIITNKIVILKLINILAIFINPKKVKIQKVKSIFNNYYKNNNIS